MYLYDQNKKLKKYLLELNTTHPGHDRVRAVTEAYCTAVEEARGTTIELTEADLAYRRNEDSVRAVVGPIADRRWRELVEEKRAAGLLHTERPMQEYPDLASTSIASLAGRYVVLEDFRWPRHQFSDAGRDLLFIGRRGGRLPPPRRRRPPCRWRRPWP